MAVLDIVALALITIHFGVPIAYYHYLKKKWFSRPWNIKIDPNYKPKVTIIIPTYNEAEFIEKKLDNIYEQDYPRDKVEVILVDSASTDGTPQLINRWKHRHPELKLRLLEEPVRRGMNPALNYALKHVLQDIEIVIFTDADAFWEKDTLKQVVKYFADPEVGAVTTCIAPLETKKNHLEEYYRSYYNILRVAESKAYSTPVHNGALIAYRKKLLDRIGGIPTYTGNNDSTPASLIAFMGYRAIQIDDTIVKEPAKRKEFWRKVRRAQHLILHFLKTKDYAKKLNIYKPNIKFETIWRIQFYLHIINPHLLCIALALLLYSTILGSGISLGLLALGAILLLVPVFRTWILTQIQLIIAIFRNILTREIVWSK